MELHFHGQITGVRQAVDRNKQPKPGMWKLGFMTMPEGNTFEVSSRIQPTKESMFVPADYVLVVSARTYQGLLSLTVENLSGQKNGKA